MTDRWPGRDRQPLTHGEPIVSSGSVVDAHVDAIVNAANERVGRGGRHGATTKPAALH